MMSTYSVEDEGTSEWYEHTSLPEIMKIAGYKTHWYSNQAKAGNSIINRYADLFDDCTYNGDKFTGDERKSYDGELVNLAKHDIEKNVDSLNFYVFHLMGSHFKFNLRYPQQYEVFKDTDYLKNLEKQRNVLAAYDNSVLYNDYVVYQIMNIFNNKEAIVIYLSDHGLDVFYTDNNYAAHAKMNNPKSIQYGIAIPFLIYTTPHFNRNHPRILEKINNSKSQSYRTDSLIYTIMDLVGIRSINGFDINKKSILRDY